MAELFFSTYEAKAKLSELLRKVRRGRSVVITSHGNPVAKIVPYEARESEDLEVRLALLEEDGVVTRSSTGLEEIRPLASRKGALTRFLEHRS